MTAANATRDRTLTFLAATARDAETMEQMLAPTGIHVDVCRSFQHLLDESAEKEKMYYI